ncbi:MAG: glutaredoxin 3 [Pseudomonadota bacterium]
MKSVQIYTRPMCPYCTRAKALLQKKEVDFEELDAFMNAQNRKEMIARSGGARTYPQIFIGDTHVGGCDELHAVEREGKLDALLAE